MCFHSIMKHKTDVSKLWEFTASWNEKTKQKYVLRISYFSLVKNNNFIKIKHFLRAFIAWWKPRRTFGENSTADRERRETQSHLLENSHKRFRGFHQVMKARKTCLISQVKELLGYVLNWASHFNGIWTRDLWNWECSTLTIRAMKKQQWGIKFFPRNTWIEELRKCNCL